MRQPKVSVIVPVYNMEKYLHRCLDSIASQTLQEIEIICVNDGSTDGSRAILSGYEKSDPRFRVVDKENEGQGVARNAGINLAKGEYIGFVDADDWVDPAMYETMYADAKKNNTDLQLCGVKRLDAAGSNLGIRCDYDRFIGEKFCSSAAVFTWHDVRDAIFKVGRFCWNKIYKRSFIQRNNISFSLIRCCYEDNIFHFRSFLEADRIAITRKPFYNYIINREGAESSRSKKILPLFDINREIKKYMADYSVEKEMVRRFDNFVIRRYLSYCYITDKAVRRPYFNRMKYEFQDMDIKHNPFVKGPQKIFYLMVRRMPYGMFKHTYIPGYLLFYAYMSLWFRSLKIDPLDVV